VNRFQYYLPILISLPIKSWLEFAVLISAIGIGLMNFAKPDDPIGLAAGISFTIIALLAILYAGGMYAWRTFSSKFCGVSFGKSGLNLCIGDVKLYTIMMRLGRL